MNTSHPPFFISGFRFSKRHSQRGFTLLEVTAAMTILAICIVPATRLLTTAMSNGRILDRQAILATLTTDLMEDYMARSADVFTTGTIKGDFSTRGLSEYNYLVIREDTIGVGGYPDKLLVLTSRVWHDANGNGSEDTGEMSYELATKIAFDILPN